MSTPADPRPPDLQLWQVHEGPEHHVVIAFDAAQARGIAFGHRFADPDEWGDEPPTMPVSGIAPKVAMRIVLEGEPCDGAALVTDDDVARHLPRTLAYCLAQATEPDYLGGSLW